MDSTEYEQKGDIKNILNCEYDENNKADDTANSQQVGTFQKRQIVEVNENEQVYQKYSLPFQNCLNAIKSNIILPNIERMKEILKQVKQNYSYECFDQFAQHYLSKLLQIIKAFLHLKEYENAIEILIFLDDLTQPQNYGQFYHIRITCLLFIGHYFRCVGDDHSAFQVVEQALTISNEHGSPFLKGLTYLNLGSLLSKLNDNEQAIKFFKASVLAFNESNEKLVSQIREGQTRKKSQAFLYSHQNQSLALHNLGIEYEKNDDVEMAFLSYFNSYMNARDHLGSQHQLTKSFLNFLKQFVKKLDWQVQNIENLFEDPNSYLSIIRKQKKISNPYFETFNFEQMENIAKCNQNPKNQNYNLQSVLAKTKKVQTQMVVVLWGKNPQITANHRLNQIID